MHSIPRRPLVLFTGIALLALSSPASAAHHSAAAKRTNLGRTTVKRSTVKKGRRAGMQRIFRTFSERDNLNVEKEVEYIAANRSKELHRTFREDTRNPGSRLVEVVRTQSNGKLDGFQETYILRNGRREIHRAELRRNGALVASGFAGSASSLTVLKKALQKEAAAR